MDKPLQQLNAFYTLAEERMLAGSDQLLYLHLFNLFNRAFWSKTIQISDKELLKAMRLYESTGKPANVNTIRNSKSRLKLKGFIDFKAGNGKDITEYSLTPLYPCDTPCDTPNDTPCYTPCDTLTPSQINNAGEDNKDIKTLRQKKEEEEERGRAQEVKVSEKVLETWEAYTGTKAIQGTLLELRELENFAGIDAVVRSIREVYRIFNKVTIGLVNNRLYRKPSSEGVNDNGKVIGDSVNCYAGVDEF